MADATQIVVEAIAAARADHDVVLTAWNGFVEDNLADRMLGLHKAQTQLLSCTDGHRVLLRIEAPIFLLASRPQVRPTLDKVGQNRIADLRAAISQAINVPIARKQSVFNMFF